MKHLSLIKKNGLLFFIAASTASSAFTQTIGTFNSVTPTVQTQNLVLPATHKFQRLIKSGDALSMGGNLGTHTDFTGYVPILGSSRNGYLSISNESTPAGVAILGISYNTTTHLWTVNSGGNVSFPATEIGATARFCSGTVTPNNTIIVSEEDLGGADMNTDGYQDRGWLIEIDPATRTVINQDGSGGVDKLWALGRTNRENAAIKSNNMVLYTGADDGSRGYLYKFIPTVAGNFSNGTLYVLETTAGLGNGTWRIIPNTTIAQRENIRTASNTAGAYNFNGIEDVEFGPGGKIYFAAKSEGKIYRFTDNGTFGTATDISGLEVFAGNDAYPTIKSYDIDGAGGLPLEPWGRGNDNLAFDGEGNLWVCQDAIDASDRNHIWVIGPTHTQASPQVKVFATTPTQSEPTGITFTPDYKFMFLSFMSPTAGNTTAQTDAANVSVVFNTHTTVVIGRVQSLGALATLPVTFTAFDVNETGADVLIKWTVSDINNHDYFSVERSVNGSDFEEIHRNNDNINGVLQRAFSIIDNTTPYAAVLYYRIKQCDLNGSCHYSEIKIIKRVNQSRITAIYPQPAKEKLNIKYLSLNEGPATITVTDINGRTVIQKKQYFTNGLQSLIVSIDGLSSGIYLVTVTDKNFQQSLHKFIKD